MDFPPCAPRGSFLPPNPNISQTWYGVYSFFPLNTKDLGKSEDPRSSWMYTIFPYVMKPTNAFSGNFVKTFWIDSFKTYN